MRIIARSLYLGLVLAIVAGCSKSTSVPEKVVASSLAWLEDLRAQVATKDFVSAIGTVKKIDEQGTIDATNLSDYLILKSKALIGSGEVEAAKAVIDELERGGDDLAVVHVLRGELALKSGVTTVAQEEFAKAKKLDPNVVLPKM